MVTNVYFDIVAFEVDDVPEQVPADVEVLARRVSDFGFNNFAYNELLGLYAFPDLNWLHDPTAERVHVIQATLSDLQNHDAVIITLDTFMDLLEMP